MLLQVLLFLCLLAEACTVTGLLLMLLIYLLPFLLPVFPCLLLLFASLDPGAKLSC